MNAPSTAALDELELALAGDGPLDVAACRRLALRATRWIDGQGAAYVHETLCSVIDVHAEDPADARRRFRLLRPAIEILADRP